MGKEYITKLGLNGLVQISHGKEQFLKWGDIVGINSHYTRSEIYLKSGDIVRLKNPFSMIYSYHVFDYGDNQIGEGEPEVLYSWGEIFKRLKLYIFNRGNMYISEFESLYNAWLYVIPGLFPFKKALFSKDELNDIRILRWVFFFFIVIWFSIIGIIFFNNKPIQDIIPAYIIIIGFIILFSTIVVTLFKFGSKKKIYRILDFYNVPYDE